MAGDGKNRVVFLDRDGTIIVDKGYLNDPEQVEFFPDVIDGLKRLYLAGFKFIIVTNQSGINRGLIEIKNLELIHKKIVSTLTEHGVTLYSIYYCPHLPEENCNCRKPKIGLVEHLLPDVDISSSYLIGDKLTDIEFGKNLKVKTILLTKDVPEKMAISPDFICKDFSSAVEWILNNS